MRPQATKRLRCEYCGKGVLLHEGQKVLEYCRELNGTIYTLHTQLAARWMGQKLFDLWRCPHCRKLYADEVKKLP